MSRRLALCLLAICMSATVAWGQNVVKIPFQYVADRGVFVENEFIVVLNEQARANVVATRGPSGEPRLNETSLQRLVERHGVARFERQFPTARAQRAGMNRVDLTGHYKVKLLPGQSLELATRGFAADPNVDHVERIGVHPVYATPNDPFYQGSPDPFFPYDQWHLWNNYSIAADQAWNTETGNGDVLVGIIDSGLRYFHADIGGNVAPWGPDNPHTGGNVFVNGNEIPGNGIDDDGNGFIDDTVGWDFVTEGLNDLFVFCFDQDCEGADNNPDDGEGHGTHVAGTVAAITNNDILCAGVAGGFGDGTQSSVGNGAKVIPLRIGYRAYYYGYFVGIVRMDWAAEAMVYTAGLVDAGHNVAAVNCSWGSSDSGGLAAAVDYLLSRDVMIVHAAGNSGDSTPDFLATLPRVMNVAATDASGRAATFTSFGSWVHVAAPGVDVVSTWTNPDDFDINNHYVSVLSGTSMAAPHVCGIAALLEAAKPSLTAQAKFDLIVNNVSPYKGRANIGSGIANARLALDAALAGDPPSCDIVAGFSAVPTTGTVPLAVAFTDESTNASSWLWDFGDGTVSTMQNPTHTYTEPGIYSVTQSVTSNCGSAERTQTDYITVNEQTGGGIATKMFVSDIRLAREDLGKGRKRCVATVTIRDDRGGALPDATVTGGFTGKTNDGGLSSTSDLDGKAVFISGEAKGGRGEWCFTVTSVSHPTLVYDPSLNVATQMCESSGTLASHFAGPDAPSITWASPNPFNPETRIHFVLPEAASVELVVYDVRGRVVRRLVADRYPAGSHSVGFDARNDAGRALPSGVYFYRLTGPGGTETRKLMLLK